MKVSVVIPSFNSENLLRKNLPRVIEAVGDSEIIVSDDASSDGSLKILENYKGRIKILKNRKNMGFSSNVNLGVNAAKGEIIVLLNTDVYPEKGFLIPLLEHFKDKKTFAVGCMDKSVEKDGEVLRGRGLGEWKKGLLIHSRGEIGKKDTLWVSCGSGAFKKAVWVELNGLNELYNPFYWEDIDLSYRALKSGYKTFFEPKSIVIHEHEKGIIKTSYSESEIKTFAYRNQFIFIWKNITDINLLMSHILWLPYHFVSAILRKDREFARGFFLASKLLPKIMVYKKAEKHILKLTDKEVLKPFIDSN